MSRPSSRVQQIQWLRSGKIARRKSSSRRRHKEHSSSRSKPTSLAHLTRCGVLISSPVHREQDFANYLALHDYRNAILLALSMAQPGRLHSLFAALPSAEDASPASITGHAAVDEVLRTLPLTDLARLLRYVRDWNAHAKTSAVAQRVLHAIVKLRPADDLSRAFDAEAAFNAATAVSAPDAEGTVAVPAPAEGRGATALKELIDALIPYTERHLTRMEKLLQDSYVVEHLLSEMDDGMFGELGDEDEDLDSHPMDIDRAIAVSA